MNEISALVRDARPIVRRRENRLAPWLFAGVTAVGGIFLFTSLEQSRASRDQANAAMELGPPRPLPELAVPPLNYASAPPRPQARSRPGPAVQLTATQRAPLSPRVVQPRIISAPAAVAQPAYYPPASQPPMPISSEDSPQQTPPFPGEPAPGAGTRAQRISAPTFTIVEGTLIPAILETALDSSASGPVRAIVSRDVRGFDGSRTLVPRGSRLIGSYDANVSPGQNRAIVQWTRLIRPDGVSIDLRAPATDALGRVGVRGRLNHHTLRRLTDSLLQTIVNAGSGFTQRASPVIVMAPAGPQTAPLTIRDPSAIQPTLTVAQGARVNVFVSQDLDFSSVDGGS